MTAHGAYTQLLSKAHSCRDFSKQAAKNIKTLMVAGPLPEDEELIADMLEIRDRLRAVEQQLYDAMHDTHGLVERYLHAHQERIRKPYKLGSVVVFPLEKLRIKAMKQE